MIEMKRGTNAAYFERKREISEEKQEEEANESLESVYV